MIRTKSGRASKTQLLHMISIVLQGMNVSFFVAVGVSAEKALIIATILGIVQSGLGFYLRKITSEPM